MDTIDVDALREECEGPGKFEGEGPATVYFYGFTGEGEILSGDGDEYSELISVDDRERAAFGWGPEIVFFLVSEDYYGFVRGEELTAEGAQAAREEAREHRRAMIRENFRSMLRIRWDLRERGEVAFRLVAEDSELGVDVDVYSWDTESAQEDIDGGFLDGSGFFGGREVRSGPLLQSAIETAEARGAVDAALSVALGEV